MGFYYRNFADKLPQVLLTQVGPNVSRYNLIYADNIDMYVPRSNVALELPVLG